MVARNKGFLALNTVHVMDCLGGMERLPHEYVDLVFADPPYNIGVDYGNGSSSLDRHDAYYDWCSEWFRAVERVLRQGGTFYLMHYPEHVAYLLQAIPKLVINDDFVALNDYRP
jgi:site-specific DNA-methyltransferase (adenine-specific)